MFYIVPAILIIFAVCFIAASIFEIVTEMQSKKPPYTGFLILCCGLGFMTLGIAIAIF